MIKRKIGEIRENKSYSWFSYLKERNFGAYLFSPGFIFAIGIFDNFAVTFFAYFANLLIFSYFERTYFHEFRQKNFLVIMITLVKVDL